MIGYINIAKFKPHFDSLWNDNNTALCDVIGIGETWLKPNEAISNLPSNYNNHFINDNNDASTLLIAVTTSTLHVIIVISNVMIYFVFLRFKID